MLRIRPEASAPDGAWLQTQPGGVLSGLREDSDYLVDVGDDVADVFIDDVRLESDVHPVFRWRPAFYAGQVIVESVCRDGSAQHYFLDISPKPEKSGKDEFDGMVADIRAFDESLLGGTSSATMGFGCAGRAGRYELDILLARVREHGPSFLDAVEGISRSPHRFLTTDRRALPLSQVRRLHYSSLQDRRLVAIATGANISAEVLDSFQVNGLTSSPTFDTPANRTLLALLRRFSSALVSLTDAVLSLQLGTPQDEQRSRAPRRLEALKAMQHRARLLLTSPLFREVSSAQTSSAGLTQIAAQPAYSRAYRLGSRALATQVEGSESADSLHVAPSWGIYEIWCFLAVLKAVSEITGHGFIERPAIAAPAERATTFELSEGHRLEVLFQAVFRAVDTSVSHFGQSLSRERRPDVLLVRHLPNGVRALVLDAKWRSGRSNVLDAMESAHIYHDALRVGSVRPNPCVLMLPGQPEVEELEKSEFVEKNGVGAISAVRIGGDGLAQLSRLLSNWLGMASSSQNSS